MSGNTSNSASAASRLGISRLAWLTPVLGTMVLVSCVAGFSHPLAAQEGHRAHGTTAACPAPEPCLETPMGRSLYWHDPCGAGYGDQEPAFDHNSVSPKWFVMTEFMPLFRDTSNPLALGGTLGIGTGSLDSDFAAGGRITVGLGFADWYRLEFSSYACDSWSDTVAAQKASIPVPGETEFHSLRFSAQLADMQLNLRRRMAIAQNPHYSAEASTILGLRYMRIEDDLHYWSSVPLDLVSTAIDTADVDADNDLFGVQLGLLVQVLARERAWVDFEIKGGIFSNRAEINSTHTYNLGTTPFAGAETRTAFLGDLSATFNYQFAPAWTFRAGYNAMWLTGLALASANTSADASLPPLSVHHDGNTVYHGPTIGVVWAR